MWKRGGQFFLFVKHLFRYRWYIYWCLMIEKRCKSIVQKLFQTSWWSYFPEDAGVSRDWSFQKMKMKTRQLWKSSCQLSRIHRYLLCSFLPKCWIFLDKPWSLSRQRWRLCLYPVKFRKHFLLSVNQWYPGFFTDVSTRLSNALRWLLIEIDIA